VSIHDLSVLLVLYINFVLVIFAFYTNINDDDDDIYVLRYCKLFLELASMKIL